MKTDIKKTDINNTIIDTIGNTPLVKLNKLPQKYNI